MTLHNMLLLLFLALLRQEIEINCNSTLRQIHVFFRHGSRTPELKDVYPNDPYKWPTFSDYGWGQLTNIGKGEAYLLGQKLRLRYNDFLGEDYKPNTIHAYTTDYDRTKATVLLVLASLFPPQNRQVWNEKLMWLPIPYHYEKHDQDYTLRRPLHYCPMYKNELYRLLKAPVATELYDNNAEWIKRLALYTGRPMNHLLDVFGVYQTLDAERNMKLELPKWTSDVTIGQIANISAKLCNFENYNTLLKRLNGGRSLSKVLIAMTNAITNSTPDTKHQHIYLYSGHENNVINILAALNLFKLPHVPYYTAAVILELHQMAGEAAQHAIKVAYLRHASMEFEEMQLDNCALKCPFDKFMTIMQPYLPVNYTEECRSTINLD